jgi:hypothetical protein
VVCDNDLESEWSRDREKNDNTEDARIFRQVQASWRITVLRPVFLYCSWQLVRWFKLSPGGASTHPFISRGVRLQER